MTALASKPPDFYKADAMILSCPACRAGFLVSATMFMQGPREVRCARCAHAWSADMPPSAPNPSVEDALAVEIKPVLENVTLPVTEEKPPSTGRLLFVVGLVVLLAAVLGWFVFDRADIERDHPNLAGVYDRLGLHVYHPGEGLTLEGVHSELHFESGLMQLIVEGRIRNDTAKTQEIPNLLATAIGPDGNAMQSWQIDAPAAKVAPGEALPFTSAIRAPKGTVIEVNLNFIEPTHAP